MKKYTKIIVAVITIVLAYFGYNKFISVKEIDNVEKLDSAKVTTDTLKTDSTLVLKEDSTK